MQPLFFLRPRPVPGHLLVTANRGCKRSGEKASRFVVQGEMNIRYAGYSGIYDQIPLGTPTIPRSQGICRGSFPFGMPPYC